MEKAETLEEGMSCAPDVEASIAVDESTAISVINTEARVIIRLGEGIYQNSFSHINAKVLLLTE